MGDSEGLLSRIWTELGRVKDDVSEALWSPSPRRPTARAGGERPDLLDQWNAQMERVDRVRAAIDLSGPRAQGMLTARFADLNIGDISDVLIEAVKEIAIVYGATVVAGAAVGFLIGGPAGAGVGALAGAGAAPWILGFLGLKSLVQFFRDSIPQALAHYKEGFTAAWSPLDGGQGWGRPSRVSSQASVERAANQFALGHVLLIAMILMAIVAYLTRGKGNKAKLIKEIRESRHLGPRVARWVEAREAQLVNHPEFRPRKAPSSGGGSSSAGTGAPKPPGTAKRLPDKPAVADMTPGSPAHKADRWQKYQARGGKKSYEQWSRQYDVNMRNYQHGAQREAAYREAMGAGDGTVKTSLTNRQVDILKADEMYAGQLKTGPVSLTKENALAIQKDAELVRDGWTVEHILEKGASKPYLEALKSAGIDYRIGPAIP